MKKAGLGHGHGRGRGSKRGNLQQPVDYVPLLVSLFVVDLLAAMSPGPNTILAMQTAIHGRPRSSAAVVLGFVTSNLIWCLAVVFGLSTIFELAPWLYRAMRVLGGAYLIHLGVSLWRSQSSLEGAPAVDSGPGAACLRGVITNLSNPKSVVYFGSIFAVFLGPDTPAMVKAAAIGIVLADTVLWYGTVADLFSAPVVQQRYRALQRPINRAAGTVMGAFGARLMLARD